MKNCANTINVHFTFMICSYLADIIKIVRKNVQKKL